ncbi:MAG: 23S rRNA (adenine(2030)-N(6))-methyltransferase RlmJ [Pseudomonadota bacterium]
MNYRHAFHAGNFADAAKHLALMLVLEHLAKKDKPFAVLDTHAGRGRYVLDRDEAARTGEAGDGITRLIAATDPPEAVSQYLALIAEHRKAFGETSYPGSPLIAAAALRKQDRLLAIEAHREEAAGLKKLLANFDRATVTAADGWAAIKAKLPPIERRGLILIDPPYEAENEERRVIDALREGRKRFATGIFLAWYPIKARARHRDFHKSLARLGFDNLWAADLMVQASDVPDRLNGSGLLICNPPYQFLETYEAALKYLANVLGRDRHAGANVLALKRSPTAGSGRE